MGKLKQPRSILGKIHWNPSSYKTMKVCPRCQSINIQLSTSFDIWLTPRRYICKDCGYIGPIVLEIEKTEEDKKIENG
ncbi:MAG: hypothetical protein QXX08_03725 [Candidatus Bathyarchaeia archaeon]